MRHAATLADAGPSPTTNPSPDATMSTRSTNPASLAAPSECVVRTATRRRNDDMLRCQLDLKWTAARIGTRFGLSESAVRKGLAEARRRTGVPTFDPEDRRHFARDVRFGVYEGHPEALAFFRAQGIDVDAEDAA